MRRQPLRVMGTAGIAEHLGASRQWVEVLSKRRDFPVPSAIRKAGRIWRTEDPLFRRTRTCRTTGSK